jgi:hypothetical protein
MVAFDPTHIVVTYQIKEGKFFYEEDEWQLYWNFLAIFKTPSQEIYRNFKLFKSW